MDPRTPAGDIAGILKSDSSLRAMVVVIDLAIN